MNNSILPHHKTTIRDDKGENRKFKHVLNEFKDAMMEAQGKPIIFVKIFGSYEIGKSSTLKLLTGDNSIVVGNGRDEETTGAFIYGPFHYNDFRKKFGMEIIPNNETQIFFIDTEGSGGFKAQLSNSGRSLSYEPTYLSICCIIQCYYIYVKSNLFN